MRTTMVLLLVSGLTGPGCVEKSGPLQPDPVTVEAAQAARAGVAGCDTGLFTASNAQGTVDLGDDPSIVRRRFVTVDFSRLSMEANTTDGPDQLTLNLFNDLCLVAVRDREGGVGGPSAWLGRVEGAPGSQVTLVSLDGSLAGTIDTNGALYSVRDVGGGVHAVLQIDQSQFPQEVPPVAPPGD